MLQNVRHLSAAKPVSDPFEAFSVEFGTQLQAPMPGAEAVDAPDFGDVLKNALHEISAVEEASEKATVDFATGKPVDVHTMMIAAAKADVMLQLTSAVVSKTAQGVNQLLQTQV